MIDPARGIYATPFRYYQAGIDVTFYVMAQLPMPLSERFYEVTVK